MTTIHFNWLYWTCMVTVWLLYLHGYSIFSNPIILGDLTFTSTPTVINIIHLNDYALKLKLTQPVNFPTHSYGHTLDIILTLSFSNLINRITWQTLLTDHYAIYCHNTKLRSTRLTTYRSFNKIDYDSFSLDLMHSMQDNDITNTLHFTKT